MTESSTIKIYYANSIEVCDFKKLIISFNIILTHLHMLKINLLQFHAL